MPSWEPRGSNNSIWGHFWSKFEYLTRSVPYIRSPPNCCVNVFEETQSSIILNVLWCYFVFTNVPNCEVLSIKTIIWIIFCQNVGSLVPIYWVPPTVMQLILKKFHQSLS